jgi:hypothetical protein
MNVDFVGSVKSGPATIDRDHEGHGKYLILRRRQLPNTSPPQYREGLGDSARLWLLRNPPDVILLEIGTNEMWRGESFAAGAIDRLGELIDTITLVAPRALLFVSSIPPLRDNAANALAAQFNAAIPSLVALKKAAGANVAFANIGAAIDRSSDLSVSDGVHPDDGGYAKMADAWSGVLMAALHAGPPDGPEVSGARHRAIDAGVRNSQGRTVRGPVQAAAMNVDAGRRSHHGVSPVPSAGCGLSRP